MISSSPNEQPLASTDILTLRTSPFLEFIPKVLRYLIDGSEDFSSSILIFLESLRKNGKNSNKLKGQKYTKNTSNSPSLMKNTLPVGSPSIKLQI